MNMTHNAVLYIVPCIERGAIQDSFRVTSLDEFNENL